MHASNGTSNTVHNSHVLSESLVAHFDIFPDRFDIMYRICSGDYDISLRMLDWLCTNFSKSVMGLDFDNTGIELYHRYKNNLRGFGKRFFDPFCRKQNIEVDMHGQRFKTTIGQLNFFRWAFENKVIDFAKDNKSRIEEHMNDRLSIARTTSVTRAENTDETGTERKRKRGQLSKLASNHCTKKIRLIRVSFS